MNAIKKGFFTAFYLVYYTLSFLVRGLVFAAGKLFKSGFIELVSRSSAPFASSVYGEANVAILISASLEGGLSTEKVKTRLKQITQNDEYKKFRSYVSKFWGFYAWFNNNDFFLENHFQQIDGKGTLEISEFHHQILSEPFTKGKSPWVVYLVSKAVKGGDVADFFVIKSHPVLADGYSLLGLAVKKVFDCPAEINLAPLKLQLSLISRAILEIKSLFQAAALIADQNCSEIQKDSSNIFNALRSPKSGKEKQFYVSSKPLPIRVIKKIKDELGTSFLSVVLAGFARALRDILLNRKIALDGNKTRPEFVLITGLPNHPGGITNHFIILLLSLPVDLEDEKDVTFVINEQVVEARKSGHVFRNAKVLQILGGLPASKLPPSLPPGVALLGSDFPGTEKPPHLMGKEVKELEFWVGPNGDLGLHFYSFSYKGEWKLNLAAHENVLGSKAETKAFADSVVNYIIAMDSSNDDES